MAATLAEPGRRASSRQAALLGLVAGACLWGLTALLGLTGPGMALEDLALDAAWRLRAWGRPADLLVVAVDEPSFQEFGLAWPWPRSLHARLQDRLRRAGARVVVWDMVFAEPGPAAEDAALAEALGRGPDTVLARAVETVDDPAFTRRVVVDPLPALAGRATAVGLAVLTPDRDGAVRRFASRLGGEETLAGAAARLAAPGRDPGEAAGLVDYPGPARTIDTVSYAAVLDPDHPLPEARIRGRVVVVGRALAASAAPLGQADTFATPLTRSTGLPMAGPEIQAAIIATLLGEGPGREVPPWVVPGLVGLALPLAGLVLFRSRPVAAFAGGLGLAAVLAVLAGGLFAWRFVWLPPARLGLGFVVLGAGATLYRGVVEGLEKRFLSRAFGRYVSPAVMRHLLARPERLELGGEEAEVTVFFSDLAGFTAFSEVLSPRELIGILNAYFTPATDIILASGGTLDKFIGDAIMAFWGAPLAEPRHASLALGAAFAMRESLTRLSRDFAARGLPSLDARMGLHAGPAVVGNVGSRERFNYTILGDTVNLASRLESLNKFYGTRMLVSQAVRDGAGEDFLFREIDRVRVKGRQAAVTVYEPVARAGEAAPAHLEPFAAARRGYLARDFAAALAGFQAAAAACPGDGPSLAFADRCRRHLAAPPPDDWDGVFVPEGK